MYSLVISATLCSSLSIPLKLMELKYQIELCHQLHLQLHNVKREALLRSERHLKEWREKRSELINEMKNNPDQPIDRSLLKFLDEHEEFLKEMIAMIRSIQ